ncbi:hypothetical protein N8309_00660, partial [Gammaproteobacteria bacterium]|nr:hypothetical protein [Gammaproteobacteria bacterium]
MKLKIAAIFFIVVCFPVYVHSAEDVSESIENIFFLEMADPECSPIRRSNNYHNNLQHLASAGIDI